LDSWHFGHLFMFHNLDFKSSDFGFHYPAFLFALHALYDVEEFPEENNPHWRLVALRASVKHDFHLRLPSCRR
jgi:hypothetical protein